MLLAADFHLDTPKELVIVTRTKRVCKLPTSDPEVFARQIQKVEPLKAAAGPGGSP